MAWSNLAMLCIKHQKFQEVEEIILKIIEGYNSDVENKEKELVNSWYWLGIFYRKNNEYEKAITAFITSAKNDLAFSNLGMKSILEDPATFTYYLLRDLTEEEKNLTLKSSCLLFKDRDNSLELRKRSAKLIGDLQAGAYIGWQKRGIQALFDIGDKESVEILIDELKNGDDSVLEEVSISLAKIGNPLGQEAILNKIKNLKQDKIDQLEYLLDDQYSFIYDKIFPETYDFIMGGALTIPDMKEILCKIKDRFPYIKEEVLDIMENTYRLLPTLRESLQKLHSIFM